MAIEPKRLCKYRRVHGVYLCGEGLKHSCDRLNVDLHICPTCSSGIKFSRGFAWVDWATYAGEHKDCKCHDDCPICHPPEDKISLMWVGEKFYSPEAFIKEAIALGVSKRIPFIPKELIKNKTWVLLAHKKAGTPIVIQPTIPGEPEKYGHNPAVFFAFRPKKIEKLFWSNEINDELKVKMTKKGIEIVEVPVGDLDHKVAGRAV